MSPAGRADHRAPPTAIRPSPGLLHTVRRLAASRRRGVVVLGRPRLGRGVRLRVARGARIVLEDGCVIGSGSALLARGGVLRVGVGATLGERCTLVGHAGIDIGERAVLGDRVAMTDFEPGIEDPERPIRLQPIAATPVSVGARARIGHGATLGRGAVIAPDGIVGAHAVLAAPHSRV